MPHNSVQLRRVAELALLEGNRQIRAVGKCGLPNPPREAALRLISQAEGFLAALSGNAPTDWRRFVIAAAHEGDPEYAQYLRLKEKFDGE
jgi:hypothetical protein